MQPEPGYRLKLRLGRLGALASLTAKEAAQLAQDDARARVQRAEGRAKRAATALLINQRAALGDTPAEIAESLGMSLGYLRQRARRWGHALRQRKGFRLLSAWVCDRHVATLDALAAQWGMSREKALSEIIEAALTAKASSLIRRVA